jgi:AMP-binding enzyme
VWWLIGEYTQELTVAYREAIPDGWFRTGDLARHDADANFFIVDRKKDLIIRGGYTDRGLQVPEARVAGGGPAQDGDRQAPAPRGAPPGRPGTVSAPRAAVDGEMGWRDRPPAWFGACHGWVR